MVLIADRSLVFYKQKVAIAFRDSDKIRIKFNDGEELRVRDKDVELVHRGPVDTIPLPLEGGDFDTAREMAAGSILSIDELAELVFGNTSPASVLTCWQVARESILFSVKDGKIHALDDAALGEAIKKQEKKESGNTEREEFLERARAFRLDEGDRRFLGDAEAFALGKSQKSRTASELGFGKSPETAHAWLLKAGIWDELQNPWPSRYGMPGKAQNAKIDSIDDDGRIDLGSMEAWAIDSEWSDDPDDALGWDGESLWVHIADPASAMDAGSPIEMDAMNRALTLYLPEGKTPMLPQSFMEEFSLGNSEKSRTLSFRIEIDSDGQIKKTEVMPAWVRIKRLGLGEAEKMLSGEPFSKLASLADIRRALRQERGAVDISIPETRIWLEEETIHITELPAYRVSEMVRELMLLAGEASAQWAFNHKLPFTFYSQEAPLGSDKLPPALAGEFAKRRLMKAGMPGTLPGAHQGLGLGMYSQVTSPLRRYLDLLAHLQLRASFSGKKPMGSDDLSMKIGMANASAGLVRKAEKYSEMHWILAWLVQQKTWEGKGIVVQPGHESLVFIPELGLETRIKGQYENNQELLLKFLKANLSKQEVFFAHTRC